MDGHFLRFIFYPEQYVDTSCGFVVRFLKMGPNQASFCLFSFFSHDKYSTITINDKSIDGVLGTRSGGDRAGW